MIPQKSESLPRAGQTIAGKVTRKSESVDPSNGLFSIDITLNGKQPGKIAAGMFGNGVITTAQVNIPLLKNPEPKPGQSLMKPCWMETEVSGYVFVTNDNKTAPKVKVVIAGVEKDHVIISQGLENIKITHCIRKRIPHRQQPHSNHSIKIQFMKITDYAVKNYQFTLVIFIMIIALGITTLLNMPRSEDPEMHAPTFTVVVVYPGTSPGDMEELVVKPLEKEIWGLENIKRIRTSIGDGVAALRVEYKYNSNVDNKYQEIVRVVNSKRPELPAGYCKHRCTKIPALRCKYHPGRDRL